MAAPDPSARETTHRPMVLASLMTLLFMSELELTIVSTAMPTLLGDLGGVRAAHWVFTTYLLASTVTLLIYGSLADRFGRKPVIFVGIALFLIGSVASGAAPSMAWLSVARTVQGLGAGALRSTATTVIGDIYTPGERLKMMGVFSSSIAAAAITGPLIGALVIDVASWRWVFYVNVPIGIAAAWLLGRGLHERYDRDRTRRFDYAGALLFGCAMTCLLAGLFGRAAPAVVLAAVLAIGFAIVERRAAAPMLPLELFANRIIVVATIANALVGAAMFAIVIYIPLFVQGVTGGGPLRAGAAFAPMIIAMPLASMFSGRVLLPVIGYRTAIRIGAAISTAGGLALALVVYRAADRAVPVVTGVLGIGNGLCFATLVVVVQQAVSDGRRGIATASVLFFRAIGQAVAVAVIGTILASALSGHPEVPAAAADDLLLGKRVAPELAHAISSAIGDGLTDAFAVIAGLFVAALAATLALPPLPPIRARDAVNSSPRS